MALLSTRALSEAGHEVTLSTFAHSAECFTELQKGITIEVHDSAKNITFSPLKKLINIITLAWRLRQVDTIIANNPPMQMVAALAKLFNSKTHTIWWHHHTPWYLHNNRIKSFFERTFIIPYIDTMVATSQFVAGQVQSYCARESRIIHPVLDKIPEIKKVSAPGNDEKILLFTHGRLEPGKGLDMIGRVFAPIQEIAKKNNNHIECVVYGTWSLSDSLKAQWIDVQPYDSESTLWQIATSGKTILAIYASTIDAFGMAPLESQSTGISTLILDRGGARETLVSDVSGEPVGRLVDTESELCAAACYFVTHKKFPENMSIVNFSHTIDYFSPQRLSSDLLSLINKTKDS